MADEAAAVVLPPIIIIKYGIAELTSVEVIQEINECVSHNQQINLQLEFPARDEDIDEGEEDEEYELFKFDATIAMQHTIFENSRYIKTIEMDNFCSDKEEHRRCFTFFNKIVQGIISNGKHLTYYSYFGIDLEQANQLADILRRSNNNNDNDNDAIESFDFGDPGLNPVTFQLLWNALLDSGVRRIIFGNNFDADQPINYNNINIDFTGMETNTSLKDLDLELYDMREEDYRNLFDAIKKNKGLVKLKFVYYDYKEFPKEMKRLFEEMLCENITLLHCCLESYGLDVQDGIFEVIQFHMKLNRMWKRYIMKRNEESTVVITRIEEGDNNENNNNNAEEERKKKLKMRLLFRVFHQKAVLRTTILFHLLSEYPDDLIDTDHFRNRYSS